MISSVTCSKQGSRLQHELIGEVFRLLGVEMFIVDGNVSFYKDNSLLPYTTVSGKNSLKMAVRDGDRTLSVNSSRKLDQTLGSYESCSIETSTKDKVRVVYTIDHSFLKSPGESMLTFKAYNPEEEVSYLSFEVASNHVSISNCNAILVYNDDEYIDRYFEQLGSVKSPTSLHAFMYLEAEKNFAFPTKRFGINMCKFINGQTFPYFINKGFMDYPEARGHGRCLSDKKIMVEIKKDFTGRREVNHFIDKSLFEADALVPGSINFLLANSIALNSFRYNESSTGAFQKEF